MNKKVWLRKALVLTSIFLFVGAGLYPIVTAVGNNTESEDESIDNYDENESSEDYKEIITLISATANLEWICRRGIFRGEAIIDAKFFGGSIWLISLCRVNGRVQPYIKVGLSEVHAYFFRGFYNMSEMSPPFVLGFALGNIEW